MEPHSSASSLTTFEQLLALPYGSTWPVEFSAPVPMNQDALRVVDVLREAQVLDIRCECIRMTVGILLEMRTAIDLVGYDAALIVARGVRLCSWEIGDRQGDHGPLEAIHGASWWIGGSELVPLTTSGANSSSPLPVPRRPGCGFARTGLIFSLPKFRICRRYQTTEQGQPTWSALQFPIGINAVSL